MMVSYQAAVVRIADRYLNAEFVVDDPMAEIDLLGYVYGVRVDRVIRDVLHAREVLQDGE